MVDQYQKFYGNNGVVAYGKASGILDHLFLWANDTVSAPFNSLSDLLQSWNQATSAAGSPARRALLCCQLFDPATLGAALDRLAPSFGDCWGKVAYWREAKFSGGPFDTTFPNNTSTPVLIGRMKLSLDAGNVPATLDDFKEIKPDGTGSNVILTLEGAQWSIDSATGIDDIIVSLDSEGFANGSIGLALPWPATPADSHPVQRAKLAFTAAPTDPAISGGDPVACRVWVSRIGDTVVAGAGTGTTCSVYLDPRDNPAAPDWVGGELNSRLLFGTAQIQSSFFSAKGDRFVLQAADGALARLGFVYDQADSDLNLSSSGDSIFHPEGLFQIVGPAPAVAGDLNISSRDMVAGIAPTEFIDMTGATHIEFVKHQPAFFLENEGGLPAQRTLLDDRNGVSFTSYFRPYTGAPAPAPYYSQPSEAPLFAGAASGGHLARMRQQFRASIGDPLPVFPRAGYHVDGNGTDADIRTLEATHLAQKRRNLATPPPAPPAAQHLADPQTVADSVIALGLTPQGLLANLPGGTYSRLYFGNPDSETERVDFSIGICKSADTLYDDLQQALAGSQLFMVFRNPEVPALQVVSPSATLYARDFQFSVGPPVPDNAPDDASPCSSVSVPMLAAAILVKYFKGKSLADLVKDTSHWACQSRLAPQGTADLKEWAPFQDGNVPDYLQRLHSVWIDPEWQGVLILDSPVADMPDILEALTPGLSQNAPQLRAHHFGLNVVPARSKDLTAGSPARPGSAFGLINYAKDPQSPPGKPAMGDKEPGAVEDPQNPPRSYGFVVESLQIGFEDSQISTFQAKVTVQFDHLFWDAVTPDTGTMKAIELDGNYERRRLPDGTTQDVFSLVTQAPIFIKFPETSYLKQLTVARAQLSVVSADRSNDKANKLQRLTAFIGFDGDLELSEKLTNLPLFTVNRIRLSSFGFESTYDYSSKAFSFGFKADGISADVDFNSDSVKSLLSFLPVKLKGMTVAIGNLIDIESDLHFQPLSFAGIGTKLQFGFLMDLDLGSIGQLAGDLSGLHVPLLLGWGGGKNPGLAFGIQFPAFNGKIDIGIQQFIRLQADRLILGRCKDGAGALTAVAIQAVNARVVMLGQAWPQSDVSFVIFIPAQSNRKPSWALSFQNGPWYIGGGYRIQIAGDAAQNVKGIVKAFHDNMNAINPVPDPPPDPPQICSLLGIANPAADGWSIAAQYKDDFTVGVAISDPRVYGLDIDIEGFELDLLYRRVNGQLGIFSIELTLPDELRYMQFGAATIRLPVIRVEVHTDGGFMADFGFPWNNDFSRSAQVEVAIFLGSGGFYYGITSAAASDLLKFEGGYGFIPLDMNDPVDSATLNAIRTVRLGFAARVGIGRSFSIGILNAEASLTLFGGLEGAAGYRKNAGVFDPTLYALKGYMGLMLDISATVSFAIIQASARILAYAEVGIEIRRVLAKKAPGDHTYFLLTLPVVLFAEIGITVSVDVSIHVGCVDITIHLSFSTTWRIQETLGPLGIHDFGLPAAALRDLAAAPAPFTWDTSYKYWTGQRGLDIYATVLPCMADAADVGDTGDPKTCAVGTMMLPVLQPGNGFSDLGRFLTGWVLLPGGLSGNPADYAKIPVTLGTVVGFQQQMTVDAFWDAFPDALLTVIGNQFAPGLKSLSQDVPYAVIPPWPGTVFSYVPADGPPVQGTPSKVKEGGKAMDGDKAAFVEYCRHMIVGTLPEIQRLIQAPPGLPPNDPNRFLAWGDIWAGMFTL